MSASTSCAANQGNLRATYPLTAPPPPPARAHTHTHTLSHTLTHRYSRNLRLTYPLKPAMLLDFLSFFPFILEEFKIKSFPGLTFLRLLRVLRLQRFLADVETFQRLVGDSVTVTAFQLQIVRAVTTVFTTLFITRFSYLACHGFICHFASVILRRCHFCGGGQGQHRCHEAREP